MDLLHLFLTFIMIGAVSFGGGYAMLPLIEHEVAQNHWITNQQFLDVIAVAGMSPGPIATNSAIFIGYQVAGVAGAAISAIGMIIPSLFGVVVTAAFFYKIHENPYIKYGFYGLKPVITALIFYAAFRFAYTNGVIGQMSYHTLSMLLIFAVSLFAMIKWRIHPLLIILGSGLTGVVLYA